MQVSIFDHALFQDEPLSEREAWLWLISKAAWKETKHRVGQNVHDVPIGSLFLTLREMQKSWRWKSDKRVRSFLGVLEREGMIELKTDAGKTQITICNYTQYQEVGRNADASGTQAGRKNGRKQDFENNDLFGKSDASGTHDETQNGRTKYTNTPTTNNTSSLHSEVSAPAKPTPRQELLKVLDADRAEAVIEHRQRIRKPITAHAAKLLAGKLSKWHDANEAADAMISNGWQGFEVEWMRRARGSPAGGGKSAFRQHQDEVTQSFRDALKGTQYDQSPHDDRQGQPSFDLESGDFFSDRTASAGKR